MSKTYTFYRIENEFEEGPIRALSGYTDADYKYHIPVRLWRKIKYMLHSEQCELQKTHICAWLELKHFTERMYSPMQIIRLLENGFNIFEYTVMDDPDSTIYFSDDEQVFFNKNNATKRKLIVDYDLDEDCFVEV